MTPKQFKARLKRLGLGTGKAAEALGVSRFSIMNWIAGRRPIPDIVAIALDGLELQRDSAGRTDRSAERASRKTA